MDTAANRLISFLKAMGRRQSLWRLLWVCVFFLHAPITAGVFLRAWGGGIEETGWSSILLLTVSNLFFITEIGFAYSLRLLSDRRRMVAFVLVIALLHTGFVERALPAMLSVSDATSWLTVAVIGVCAWRVLMREMDAVISRLLSRGPPSWTKLSRRPDAAIALPIGFQSQAIGLTARPSRAPPSR